MRAVSFSLVVAVLSMAATVLAQDALGPDREIPLAGISSYFDPPADDSRQVPSLAKALSPEPAPVTPLDDEVANCCGVYFQADGLYWGRVGTGCNQILVIDTNSTSGTDPVLHTSDLRFNGAGGMRFLVGWTPDPCRCSRCCAYELSYFGLFNWNATAHVEGPGNLAIPGDLGLASNNFFGADIIDVNYRSSLHNVELNCVKTCCLGYATLDFISGFRFITLQERFTITGTDVQEGTSSYDVNANNFLYGVQLGGRYTRHYDAWSVQYTGKAGVFLNDVSQSQVVTDFPLVGGGPFFLRDHVGADGTAVAALGEIGVTAIRPLNDTWSLRLGYMAMGLGGVALASDQLDFTDTFQSGTQLQKTGWIFVHGAVLGAEARW